MKEKGAEDEEMAEGKEDQEKIIEELTAMDADLKDEDFEYKLVGVVIHMGVADAGHYLSYINVERQSDAQNNIKEWNKTDTQTWLEFNDANISAFDFKNMAYKAYGEEVQQNNNRGYYSSSRWDEDDFTSGSAQKSHNAYMLFYEKAVKKPLKVVVQDEQIDLIKA